MRSRFAALLVLLLVVGGFALHGGDAKSERVLLTGFGPFDGRGENASALAVTAVAKTDEEVEVLVLPVTWGAPGRLLPPAIQTHTPTIILAFGEGLPGHFALEARARNARADIPDAEGNAPPEPVVDPDGVEVYLSTAPLLSLAVELEDAGFPTRVSVDAGQYLCEEMLYVMERARKGEGAPAMVVFAHMPPLGQPVYMDGQVVRMTPDLAESFVRALLKAARRRIAEEPPHPHGHGSSAGGCKVESTDGS